VGDWESGRMGEWKSGRVGEIERKNEGTIERLRLMINLVILRIPRHSEIRFGGK